MCAPSRLQQHIRNLTKDGELVARFLVETVEGKHADARYHHKLEAMKHLVRFGFSDEEQSHFWGLIPTPEELAEKQREEKPPLPQGEGWGEGENPPHPVHPVSYLDILNYDIAHLIRTETADGHTIAEFLSHVMTRQDKPYTPKKLRIRHADRYGSRNEKSCDAATDTSAESASWSLTTTVTTITTPTTTTPCTQTSPRECESTASTARTQSASCSTSWKTQTPTSHTPGITVCQPQWSYCAAAGTPTTTGSPPRCFRTTGATSSPPALSVGQKKHLAGLPTTLDDYNTYDSTDYQALAKELNEAEDLEATNNRHSCESRNPVGRGREESPLSLRERVRVKSPAESPSKNPAERENGNPVWQGAGTETTNPFVLSRVLSLSKGLSKDESASSPHNAKQPNPIHPVSYPDPDDTPDCYHEPLNPDQQAIFDYQTQIESGEYKEGEITLRQPTPEDWKAYEQALQHITELAAAEGIPLLPNPLADNLKMPNIRSP